MSGGQLLKWFILIFIGLWFVWFFTGGPERGASQEGLFIDQPESPGDKWYIYDKNYSFFDGFKSLNTKNRGTEEIREDFEQAQEIVGVSSFRDKVFLKNGDGKDSDVDQEYLIIETSPENKNRINITGWKLESVASGQVIEIGKGSYLPYASKVNYQEPIFLFPGSKVYIVTGRSPIGTSFRTNLCTGYFEQFQDFRPSLKKECPLPEDEPDFITVGPNRMNDDCIDFVEDIRRCEIVTRPLPLDMQHECVQFITTKINYDTCVKNYKDGSSFYNLEWRVYLNRNQEIWKDKRETIKLIDEKGNLVDTITY